MQKILIWQDEFDGEYLCRKVFPREVIFKNGLATLWKKESNDNYVVKNFEETKNKSLLKLIKKPDNWRLRDINFEYVDFQTKNVYISKSQWFISGKYLTFYAHNSKLRALVEVDDSIKINELSQQELLNLALGRT